jgi:hypothetical protein
MPSPRARFICPASDIGEGLAECALRNKMALLSPTNFLATMRTVASVWSEHKQNRNAQEIDRYRKSPSPDRAITRTGGPKYPATGPGSGGQGQGRLKIYLQFFTQDVKKAYNHFAYG